MAKLAFWPWEKRYHLLGFTDGEITLCGETWVSQFGNTYVSQSAPTCGKCIEMASHG